MFKGNQLFFLEINVLYNLMLNMKMFTYVIKVSSKILPFSYPFVEVCLQDWSPLCADVVFSRDTFQSNLRKTDVFPLTPVQPKWKKGQRLLLDVTGYNKRVFITQNYFTHDYLRYLPHCSGHENYNHAKRN